MKREDKSPLGLVADLGPGDIREGGQPEESLPGQVQSLPPPPYAPYREFEEARALGVIPPQTTNIGGSWSALTKVSAPVVPPCRPARRPTSTWRT